MTTICNDPAEFTDEAVEGFVDLYPRYVRRVMGGVVRAHRPARPKVAVLVGGGSGHYPAFAGVAGPGFAVGSIIGNIFTSLPRPGPTPSDAPRTPARGSSTPTATTRAT